jgi:hypothetical protein
LTVERVGLVGVTARSWFAFRARCKKNSSTAHRGKTCKRCGCPRVPRTEVRDAAAHPTRPGVTWHSTTTRFPLRSTLYVGGLSSVFVFAGPYRRGMRADLHHSCEGGRKAFEPPGKPRPAGPSSVRLRDDGDVSAAWPQPVISQCGPSPSSSNSMLLPRHWVVDLKLMDLPGCGLPEIGARSMP